MKKELGKFEGKQLDKEEQKEKEKIENLRAKEEKKKGEEKERMEKGDRAQSAGMTWPQINSRYHETCSVRGLWCAKVALWGLQCA